MKSIFAAKDADSIRAVLIDGFGFDSKISQQGKIVVELEKLGLVRIITRPYKMCANPRDHDYGFADPNCETLFYADKKESSKVLYCNFCKRTVDLDGKQIFEKYLVRLDISQILQYIEKKFQIAGFNVGKILDGFAKFEMEGKTCILCIPSHCTKAKYINYHYVYSNPILYVYLPYVAPTQNALPLLKYILLEDLICRNASWIREKVEEALSVDMNFPSADEIEQAFDDFVNRLSNDEFELFASFVFNKASKSKNGIRKYEHLLNRDQNNIHGQYAVSVGGSGRSDAYTFKKRAYLSGLFDAKWQHIEGKRYTSKGSVLDDPKFSGFFSNCKEQPGAIFMANNLVTGDVWKQVKEYYDDYGYAKYAVVPKDLLLELIVFLGGQSILEEFLNSRDDKNTTLE